MGLISAGVATIPEEAFIYAAEELACLVTEEDYKVGRIYPELKNVYLYSIKIAKRVMEYAFKSKLANLKPEPKDMEHFIRSHLYSLSYPQIVPTVYKYKDEVASESVVDY